ncbi:CoA transferase [Tomitella cavernea]|uniref:CoA transferase n=1 Tax=Tomitella cavernea TaxID=1387982 RepID=A0ABP9CND6_9ACTN|nr:CoA transferase [Tomitella cavernea]
MFHDLNGISVVSLAVNLPGPLASARLRALGARVTKIEPPAGDPLASVSPTWYRELSEGQDVLTIDVKAHPERMHALLADADLLITAMRPSALQRLGLGNIHERFPRLCHIEIVGADGDGAERPGHDLTYQAAHGTLAPPAMPTVPVADLLGAERSVAAALLALRHRDATGAGGRHRVALEDAAADAGAAVRHGLTGGGAPLGGALPGYGIYATADGHLALGALEPHFWERTCAALTVPGTHSGLAAAFASRTTAEWERWAGAHDVPLAAVRVPSPADGPGTAHNTKPPSGVTS